jgi:hypothetical protein
MLLETYNVLSSSIVLTKSMPKSNKPIKINIMLLIQIVSAEETMLGNINADENCS